MKNHKKNIFQKYYQKWINFSFLRKDFLIGLSIFLIFILALVLAWKQYQEKQKNKPNVPFSFEVPILKEEGSIESEDPLKRDITLLKSENLKISKQLTSLETRVSHLEKLKINRFIALNILTGVLNGGVPLEALRTFLQETPEIWARDLLALLSSVKESRTYPQLEALLALPSPPPPSFWKRIKNKIKSVIQIRKVKDKVGQLKDIKEALQIHDISKALKLYETLPPQEQSQLSSWYASAKNRLILEACYRDLLSACIKD